LVGKSKRERPLEDLREGGKSILKWILKLQGGRMWPEFIWLRIDTSGRFL
jgi:hypothetical protein